MPPKIRVTKDDIVNAAVELVRQGGAEAINARAIAVRLGGTPHAHAQSLSQCDVTPGRMQESLEPHHWQLQEASEASQ